MAKKTPGIYIAIRGDYSAFNTDMLKVKQLAKAQAEDIAKSINNAVSAADLSSGIYKITRELKTAQAALSAGAFKAQVSGLEEIAKAAGVSSKQLEGLTNSMLKSQAAAAPNANIPTAWAFTPVASVESAPDMSPNSTRSLAS